LLEENVAKEMLSAFSSMNVNGDPLHSKEWVEERNLKLVQSMLELEHPTITDQMVGFLSTESVMGDLLQCMVVEDEGWKLGDPAVARMGVEQSSGKEMERSYKVAMLLSGDGEKREVRVV
jgi:hypothetical protein